MSLPANSDAALAEAVLAALRADAAVQAVLGSPARLFDSESPRPVFPYAVLERHEQFSADASLVCGAEHRLTIATFSRDFGRAEAREILGALRAGVEVMAPTLTGQRLVHAHVIYSDAMRTGDRRAFRGVLRIRAITEEA